MTANGLFQNVVGTQPVGPRRIGVLGHRDDQLGQRRIPLRIVAIFQVLVVLLDRLFRIACFLGLFRLQSQEVRIPLDLISVQKVHADHQHQGDSHQPHGQLDVQAFHFSQNPARVRQQKNRHESNAVLTGSYLLRAALVRCFRASEITATRSPTAASPIAIPADRRVALGADVDLHFILLGYPVLSTKRPSPIKASPIAVRPRFRQPSAQHPPIDQSVKIGKISASAKAASAASILAGICGLFRVGV